MPTASWLPDCRARGLRFGLREFAISIRAGFVGDRCREVVVRYGEPGPRLKRARSIVSAPARLFHLPARKEPSPETVEEVSTYLRRNDLTDVPVFVNSYQPKEQWRLLRENKSIGAGWRYTAGTIDVISYTLFPGPVFRRDSYNPYTNSLNLEFRCLGRRAVRSGQRQRRARAKTARHLYGLEQPSGHRAVATMPNRLGPDELRPGAKGLEVGARYLPSRLSALGLAKRCRGCARWWRRHGGWDLFSTWRVPGPDSPRDARWRWSATGRSPIRASNQTQLPSAQKLPSARKSTARSS